MFHVAAYNLWLDNPQKEEPLAQVLHYLAADFVGLTEADDEEVVARLAERLGVSYVWAEGSGDHHIAALSRFPIQRWQVYREPPLTQAVLEVEVGIDGRSLTLYTVHFLPYLLLPFEIRRWQAVGALLDLIAAKGPHPHLIIGDFNSIAPGDRVLQKNNPARMKRIMLLQLRLIFRLAIPRLLQAGYTDCFRQLHPQEDGFTWWTINPTTRYDYIMAPPQMVSALRSCRVVTEAPAVQEASDHFPLLAHFDLAAIN